MNLQNKIGQSLTEYLILTALISVGSIAIVQLVSRNIRSKFTVVSESIRGVKKSEVKGVEAEEKHYRTLDMSDFDEGTQFNDEDE
ncbi:MAG TPA: hypothetical protein VM901_09740 [Bdellovibrionota bacterium]|jgi:Flp pilus assembly pilin Flp|nr:hypothetical protein [Bdellovibrionota bacterium]